MPYDGAGIVGKQERQGAVLPQELHSHHVLHLRAPAVRALAHALEHALAGELLLETLIGLVDYLIGAAGRRELTVANRHPVQVVGAQGLVRGLAVVIITEVGSVAASAAVSALVVLNGFKIGTYPRVFQGSLKIIKLVHGYCSGCSSGFDVPGSLSPVLADLALAARLGEFLSAGNKSPLFPGSP